MSMHVELQITIKCHELVSNGFDTSLIQDKSNDTISTH